MVRHYHPGVQLYIWEMFRDGQPTSLGNYANTIVLKEKLFVPGAYRHKIRTGLCIIVSPQSDGATVMSFGVVTYHKYELIAKISM